MPRLAEGATDLIIEWLVAGMPAALASTRTDRADALVSTEPPQRQSYFIFRSARVYRPPAIFVISDRFDDKKLENQANMINGVLSMRISAVVEDKDQERLTIKAWRYESALRSLLDETSLQSADGKLKLVIVIKGSDYSPHFTNDVKDGSLQAAFRKEVSLDCDVNLFENY